MADDYSSLPADLPRPVDDGAADHLPDATVPSVSLLATTGKVVDLAELARGLLVVYVYPRTGTPGEPLPHGWDDIPGARGCTPQSCAYRDALEHFHELDTMVIGISAQTAEEQTEFAVRERIPFPLLSDPELRLGEALGLPTFEVEGTHLYRRLTLVAEATTVVKAFYPVFPPDQDAEAVLGWLRTHARPAGAERD